MEKRGIDECTLRAWALEAGFAEAALCSAADFEDERRIVEHQPPLAERRQLRFSPNQDDSETRSLAVLLWPYVPVSMAGGGTVFVDSYYFASNAAYHAARALEARMRAAGCHVRANVSYPAREAALRAGLGVIGKNGLLITPRFGTRVVIILLATNIVADSIPAKETAECLNCGRCAQACPGKAIDAQGMSHPERCLRNEMMEGVIVPEARRKKMGMHLIGCDICQRVCPMQPHFMPAEEARFTLDQFMTADETAFSQTVKRLAEHIGRNAARPQRVRAQAALLAGNRKCAADLPVLRKWAESPFEVVRAHALWAIEQIEAEASTQSKATGAVSNADHDGRT